MDNSIRVMVERGKKKRTVACAFDWSGWDRSGKTEEAALQVLEAYRPRYAKVAALAGLSDEFRAAGELAVLERERVEAGEPQRSEEGSVGVVQRSLSGEQSHRKPHRRLAGPRQEG